LKIRYKLKAGHYLVVDCCNGNSHEEIEYWSVEDKFNSSKYIDADESEIVDELERIASKSHSS